MCVRGEILSFDSLSPSHFFLTCSFVSKQAKSEGKKRRCRRRRRRRRRVVVLPRQVSFHVFERFRIC